MSADKIIDTAQSQSENGADLRCRKNSLIFDVEQLGDQQASFLRAAPIPAAPGTFFFGQYLNNPTVSLALLNSIT